MMSLLKGYMGSFHSSLYLNEDLGSKMSVSGSMNAEYLLALNLRRICIPTDLN